MWVGNYRYAELHAHSAFTFLEGTDLPAALVDTACHLGLSGLAILDVDGMYSAVQTAQAGRNADLPIVYGTEITLAAGQHFPRSLRLPLLATSQAGYRSLCELLSSHFLEEEGRREAALTLEELNSHQGHIFALTGTANGPIRSALKSGGIKAALNALDELIDVFGKENIGVEASLQPYDSPELADDLANLAARRNLPLIATGAVRCSTPHQQPLADVLSATRLNLPLDKAEPYLPAWRTFLRSETEMLRIHHRHPEAVRNAGELSAHFSFDFQILDPGLPHFPVPSDHTEESWLRHMTYMGAKEHYGSRQDYPQAWQQIDHELEVITQLGFPGYFLIVKDIVDFCQRNNILCQGRGSAANSAVCYALGITAVDAVRHQMLFERFLSPERSGAPDIDLDIEAKERERVIQYVYERFGRRNAAMVANVITYRPKSAVRDSARAFGFPEGQVNRWSKLTSRSRRSAAKGGALDNNAASAVPEGVLQMASQLQRLPRHMGIHPGGMVLTRSPVSEICPVRWGAMEGRTVLQWDKEDCADAGLVKFDLLGLGMLTALRRCFNWLNNEEPQYQQKPLTLHTLPEEEPRVYDLLCAADTVGVFQVESRAQMNTLPRLKPRCFYDIVIEVALIRPGPIQGRAVNPYLNRKNGREPVTYLHPLLEPALKKTLGVPLFQEQLMQMAVDIAGFTPGQSDELRRAIGAKRSSDRMETLKPALFAGMSKKGVSERVQEEVFSQLQGFAEFGFPESHAFSFAYLVYASAWMKVFHPEHFYASILASQPMGFYSPASLIEDAKRHGVKVAPPSVVFSDVMTRPQEIPAHIEPDAPLPQPDEHGLVHLNVNAALEVRLGLETIKGLGQAAERIVEARKEKQFTSLADLARRAHLSRPQMEKLAGSGALDDLGVSRREGLWSAGAVTTTNWYQPFIPGTEVGSHPPSLPTMSVAEQVAADYRGMGLSTTHHPMVFVREELQRKGVLPLHSLATVPSGKKVWIAGIITHRQRPSTAGGTTFLSMEDETGLANVICSVGLWRRYYQIAHESDAMLIRGRIEKGDGAIAVVAEKLQKLPIQVKTSRRDFR